VVGSDGSFRAVVPTPPGQSILTVTVTPGGHATGLGPTQCRFVWHVGLAPGRLAVCQKSQ
jgi:hypothetical protein